MAEMANIPPEARPNRAGRTPPVASMPVRSEISTTPAVAMRMAATMPGERGSCRKRRPSTATNSGSVFRYATVTTKERSVIVISISAVPPIWVSAPHTTQTQNIGSGCGKAVCVKSETPARKRSAKGKPNRNRTCVAPTAPRLAVNSRCMALRAVWPAAATKVKITQRKFMSCASAPPPHRRTIWPRPSPRRRRALPVSRKARAS